MSSQLIMGFLQYNKRWTAQALVCLSVVIYIGYSTISKHLSNEVCLAYAIARGFGAILKLVFMPSIIPPICRVLFTEIRNSRVGRYIGLDRRIIDHQLFAFGATVAAIIHMAAHYHYRPESFWEQPGQTGMMMLASLIFPLFGVFLIRRYCSWIPAESRQKYSYGAQVLRPHQLGAIIFLSAYAYHVPDGRLRIYALMMAGIYLGDRIWEYFRYTHFTKIRRAIKIPGTDYILLTVEKPKTFGSSEPGQYVVLSFPEIDAFLECCHPFTISSDTDSELTFLIRKTGPWTQRLSELIDEVQTGYNLKITIIGPFGSSLHNFSQHPELTFIGTGIGVTPFLSYLNYHFNHDLRTPKLDIHFSQRSISELIPCISTLKHINPINIPKITVHLYVTGKLKDGWRDELTQLESSLGRAITSNCKTGEVNEQNRGPIREQNKQGEQHQRGELQGAPIPIARRTRSAIRLLKSYDEFQTDWISEVRALTQPEHSDQLQIYIYLTHPNFEKVVAKSAIVAVCSNPKVINDVTRVAHKYQKRCLKETF